MTPDLSAGASSPQSAPGVTPDSTTPASARAGAPQVTQAQANAAQANAAQKQPSATKPKSRRYPLAPRGARRRVSPGRGRMAGVVPDARTMAERRIRIGSPTALLAVVPVLLGFEPGISLVVLGTERPGMDVRVTLRYDLPEPGLAAAVAEHAMSVLSAQRIHTAVAVGYGPERLVSPVVNALRDSGHRAGITLTELLRAEGRRFWSYRCNGPASCPPEGTLFDVTDHPAARALTAAGGRVLASRDELTATVAPVTGDSAERMREATREAEERIGRAVSRAARSGRRASVRRLIATVGLPAVSEAIGHYRGGGRLEPREAAWLAVVLRDLRVRDDAWSRMRPENREAHRRLWTDLTRLARPGYVAAPAALLAFVAWQSGNGALANVALDRALADEPDYSMAVLLRQVLDSGAPPSLARLPMTPDDVAASYDALEDDSEEDGEEDGEAPEAAGQAAGYECRDGQDG